MFSFQILHWDKVNGNSCSIQYELASMRGVLVYYSVCAFSSILKLL